MNKSICLFLLVCLFISSPLWAQKKVSGKVCDLDGKLLADVQISLADGTVLGTSLADGRFAITLTKPVSSMELYFQKSGFHTGTRLINGLHPLKNMRVLLSPLSMIQETVLVRAGRQSVPLAENPAATAIVDSEQLNSMPRGVGAEEALRLVPGVKVDNQADGERVHLSMRGQGILTERGIRGIQILLDGIPLNDPSGFAPDLFDVDWAFVDRIEVVRGPMGVLYGGGSAGGMLRIDSQPSGDSLNGSLKTVTGAHGFYKMFTRVGGRSETLAYSFAASRSGAEGYREHTAFWANNLHGNITWTPSTRLEISAILIGTGFFNENAEGLNLGWLAKDRHMANPDALTFNEFQKTLRQTLGLKGKLTLAPRQTLNVVAYLRHTGYLESVPSSVQHRAFMAPGFNVQYDGEFKLAAFTQHLSIGVDSDWQHIDDWKYPNLGLAKEGPDKISDQVIRQRRLGLYCLDRMELSPHWTLLLGVRHDRVRNQLDDLFSADALDLSGQADFNKTTARLGLAWNPGSDLSVYAGWGLGFIPPATEELFANPAAPGGFNTTLVPATSQGGEIGIRGHIGARLFYDLALFRLDTRNDFERYRISSRPLETFYRNAGNSRRWGVESYLHILPFQWLTLTVAYTYSDFTYTTYNSSTFPGDLSGHLLPNSPVHQLGTQMKITLPGSWYLEAGADAQSKAYVDPVNAVWIDGYILLHGRLAYRFDLAGSQAEVFLQGRNLAGTKYIAFTEPDPDGNSYQPGPQAEVFIGVNLGFN